MRCSQLGVCCGVISAWMLHAAAVELPAGFNASLVASGISSPTAMSFAPDGRLFVCQQSGELRVVEQGLLLTAPFLTVPTDTTGERGLLGVAFPPGFATNQFVYVYYTVPGTPPHNRVSRFTAAGDIVVPGSELVILDLDGLGAENHNGGAIHFGLDGKLYVAVGDNAQAARAQFLENLFGKILRLNPDGTAPADNPFYQTATGINRAIWALGLRNPFTFAFQPGTGRMFINDVGEITWEEINEGAPGANFGWPLQEGIAEPSAPYVNPLHAYEHAGGSGCITGGTFYNPTDSQFPAEFVGRYFFADFTKGWIHFLDPAASNSVSGFASGISCPVDLATGPDGALYVLARTDGSILKLRADEHPAIVQQPASLVVPPGVPGSFTVAASGSEPLGYQWKRNGSDIPGAIESSYVLPSVGVSDSGAVFRVVVTNVIGSITSNPALLNVVTTPPPVVSILSPAADATYRAGDTVQFAGSAAVSSSNPLPPAAYSWTVAFHHDDHTHPFLGPISGVTNGSFTIPTQGETSSDVFYRISLSATNAQGLVGGAFVDLLPRTSVVTLVTFPPGFSVTLDGQPTATPVSFAGVVGMTRTLGIISPQSLNGTAYGFLKWSGGGNPTHEISTPESNLTFAASFVSATGPPVLSLARAGNEMVLSWPGIFSGYTVEASPSLTPIVRWQDFAGPITNVNGQNRAFAAVVDGGFFRLFEPYTNKPRLQLEAGGNQLILRWPGEAAGYGLQSTPDLGQFAAWSNVNAVVTVNNGLRQTTVNLAAQSQFFRLAKFYPIPPPLGIAPVGDQLLLSWPSDAVGFVLQTTFTPSIPWSGLSNSICLTNEQNQLRLPWSPANQFFRLFKPGS